MKEMVGTAAAEDCRVPHLPPPDQLAGAGGEEKGVRPADQLLVAAVLQQMENSHDNDMKGPNIALAAPHPDIEMGILQRTPPVEDGVGSSSSNANTMTKERKLDFDLKVSLLLITLSMIPLTDILFLHGPSAKLNLTLKLSAFVAFTTFASAVCLMFHTFKLMAVVKPEQFLPKSQLRASRILFSIAVGSLFLTCISITYSLLPKAYYFLPLALLPSLLVGGFHFLYGADTANNNGEIVVNPARIKALKKELKRATQLTLSLVSMSFSGFIGVLLAIYHKAASLGAAFSYAKVSVYLLLGGGFAGALALFLCRLLSSIGGGGDRQSSGTWQRAILAAANAVMTAMLVPAVLMFAETILHRLLVGAAFPVVAGAAAWLLVEFCTADGGGSAETEDDGKTAQGGTMYAIAAAVASVSFGAILAVFGGMLGGGVGKEQLKACTFLLASAFVAAVSLGAVVLSGMARPEKTKASTAFAAAVLTCCGLGTIVLAALALFYQIGV
ncbi:hypothetical protein C2845_PM09G21360 [Panicum miliaceum]|uniref:Uncharacterized protein n=1 Tax=Panicum miliaceum TaxID=4540 RepID=A0A3L6RWQ7_PANMI|nr:hypothetical protein C2845_PM09G21360 [Panicum miliaceum]